MPTLINSSWLLLLWYELKYFSLFRVIDNLHRAIQLLLDDIHNKSQSKQNNNIHRTHIKHCMSLQKGKILREQIQIY